MAGKSIERSFARILARADIKINGSRPWDMTVRNPSFYNKVMAKGDLGLGESYMDGDWDCKALDEFFYRFLSKGLDKRKRTLPEIFISLRSRLINVQSKSGSRKVARQHYDLSPELYESFLDPYNQYTCGYFKNTKDLNKAQEQKLDLICKKLMLKKGDRVLDIGCGWGGFAKFAAKKYGVHVTGISISKEQVKYAKEFCKGLDVEIRLQDYRDVRDKFDKILICGMIEHVGYKNYRNIMEVVNRNLKPGGLFLLHTIARHNSVTSSADMAWLSKYIFPNSMLPSAKQITSAAEGLFILQDWQNFAPYYDKTLMAWHGNFTKNWPKIKHNYDERFYRMWTYYLLLCAGTFRAGKLLNLWQIVFSKGSLKDVYIGAR
jgi:cyclopropane-fatty-acyl-phospholipid synthase